MKYLLMTLLIFFGSLAHAEVVNFECTYGSNSNPISHSVDMTNKTWEKTEGGVTIIFDDVVASSNSISVTGQYGDILLYKDTHVISRVDLSYSFKYVFSSPSIGVSHESDYVGQCKIVEAPPVYRAF